MQTALIISTLFFPFPNVGAVRMTNWARELPSLGYRPVVICQDYGHRASPATLAEKVHPDVKLLALNRAGQPVEMIDRKPPTTNTGPKKKLRMIDRIARLSAAKWITPDLQVLYWKKVIDQVKALAREEKPDVLISSSPLHSTHWAARHIQHDLGIPWLADFRDPHVIDPRFQPIGWARPAFTLHRRAERQVYVNAQAITHAVPLHCRWARMAYPSARHKCHTLRHPVPTDIQALPPRLGAQRLSIRTVGTLGPEEARLLVEAVALLIDPAREGLDLELNFVGYAPANIEELRPQLPSERLLTPGRLSHEDAKRAIAEADVLVNTLSSQRQKVMGISSKLYEFSAAGRPIININPTRADRSLIRELGATELKQPDVAAVKSALLSALQDDVRQKAFEGEALASFRENYRWAAHSAQLRRILDQLTGVPGG